MEIKKTAILDCEEPLSKAISQLDAMPAIVVAREHKYYGIIDHRTVGDFVKEPHKIKCEKVVVKPPLVIETAGIGERIGYFLKGHFKALPVVDSANKPLGITTRVELLKDMVGEKIIPKGKVVDFMSKTAYAIEENKTIADAKKELREKDVKKLIVTRKGKPVGVASVFDIGLWKDRHNLAGGRKDIHLSKPIDLDQMKISGVLRSDMTTVDEKAGVDEAVKKMIAKNVSTVIATSDGKATGVLSALDIFKYFDYLFKEKTELQISGLGEEHINQYNHIKEKLGKVLDKFRETFNIRNAKVHIKESKKTFNVSIYFDTDNGHVSLKGERATLKETVDELALELNTVLSKKKDMRRPKSRATQYKGRGKT